jgi:hypothetical protein
MERLLRNGSKKSGIFSYRCVQRVLPTTVAAGGAA